jgi:hypothetical protein
MFLCGRGVMGTLLSACSISFQLLLSPFYHVYSQAFNVAIKAR